MLYMVECAFSDPAKVQAWNDYYTHRKLGEVLAVPGFRTSQRFKAVSDIPAPYLAIHTVDTLEVLTGQAYRGLGGGSFDQMFQPCITNWRRSFYDGLARAPVVAMNEVLAVCDHPDQLGATTIPFVWLTTAGLDAAVPKRGIVAIASHEAERVASAHPGVVNLYAPTMAQREEAPEKRAR